MTAGVDAGMVNFRRELSSWPIENFMLVDLHQHLKLFLEEFVVILEVIAEQVKGFGKGAAARHDLNPSGSGSINRRILLVNADRVNCRQVGGGAGEMNLLCLRGGHR